MERPDLRRPDGLRRMRLIPGYTMHAEGSVLIELGNTKVLCTATVEDGVPPFLEGKGRGWITAEYSMLPRATNTRNKRDVAKLKLSPRSAEIQRLVGRSLRAAADLSKLGERSVILDCDVIQADGGTRCASITGGYAALYLAMKKLLAEGSIREMPLTTVVTAVSAGIVNGEPVLDLNYAEDSSAEVDCNIVMTGEGDIVEIQGTGEGRPFRQDELRRLLALGRKGNARLCRALRKFMGEDL